LLIGITTLAREQAERAVGTFGQGIRRQSQYCADARFWRAGTVVPPFDSGGPTGFRGICTQSAWKPLTGVPLFRTKINNYRPFEFDSHALLHSSSHYLASIRSYGFCCNGRGCTQVVQRPCARSTPFTFHSFCTVRSDQLRSTTGRCR